MRSAVFYWLTVTSSSWVYFILGGLLLAIALACMGRLIIGDRKRPARNCPKCRYDMTQTPGRKCPECGSTAASERAMRRSRLRYFRLTGAAITLAPVGVLLAYFPLLRDHAATHGWPSIVPTRLLPWLMAFDGAGPAGSGALGPMGEELGRRLTLSAQPGLFGPRLLEMDDVVSVLTRMARGVPFARPPSTLWKDTYFDPLRYLPIQVVDRTPKRGWFIRRNLSSKTRSGNSSAALDAAMDEIAQSPFLSSDMRTRDAWPCGYEVCVFTKEDFCWPGLKYGIRQELNTSINGGPWKQVLTGRRGGPIGFIGDANTPNPSTIEVRIDVFRVLIDDPTVRTLMGAHRQTLQVRFAPTIDSVMTAVRDPDLDTLLQDGWFAGGRRFSPTDVGPHAAIDGTRFADVALAGCEEILCDGKVVFRSFLCDGLNPGHTDGGFVFEAGYGPNVFISLREAVFMSYYNAEHRWSSPGLSSSRWSRRVTAIPEMALRAMGADRYWMGSFEVEMPKVRR